MGEVPTGTVLVEVWPKERNQTLATWTRILCPGEDRKQGKATRLICGARDRVAFARNRKRTECFDAKHEGGRGGGAKNTDR